MIHKQTLSIEWIEQVSKANGKADKILVEKVIRALMLLEGLVMTGMPFTFKGGTALLLMYDSPKRLSIDIDIILDNAPETIDHILESFVISQGFTRVELHHRHKISTLQKAHYKFYYTPIHKTIQTEEYILLDILFESNHYTTITSIPIQSAFLLDAGEPARVQIPSIDDLLGDKLTAFAPETTGIPYFKKGDSRGMEIIKQLYDIGNLFDLSSTMEIVSKTFHAIAETEIIYRNVPGLTVADVLNDIQQTARCISLRGRNSTGNFPELQKGIQAVNSFIFAENYHIEKAISHAAKAAYLARLIETGQIAFEKYSSPAKVSNATIDATNFLAFQKLKKSNPEAFFYWWKTSLL